jgi:hypothetical protein
VPSLTARGRQGRRDLRRNGLDLRAVAERQDPHDDPVRIEEASWGGGSLGLGSNRKTHREGKIDVEGTQKSAQRTTANDTPSDGFTAEERLAIKERAKEQRAAGRRGRRADKAAEEGAVVARIAEMSEPDRAMAERLHAVIKASAPTLSAKLWYGMPAYAKDGKVVCFFQSAEKFKARYATLGFSDLANLDEGAMWPTAFALTEFTAAEEARIGELVKRATS